MRNYKPRSVSKGTCYISGPITGKPYEEVKSRFERCANALVRRGYRPVNPLDNGLPIHAAWEEHMAADIVELTRCSSIYMMAGWEASHGARLEHAIAQKLNFEVIYEDATD